MGPQSLREEPERITSRIEAPSPRSTLAKPSHVVQQLCSECVPRHMRDASRACKGNLQIRTFFCPELAAPNSGRKLCRAQSGAKPPCYASALSLTCLPRRSPRAAARIFPRRLARRLRARPRDSSHQAPPSSRPALHVLFSYNAHELFTVCATGGHHFVRPPGGSVLKQSCALSFWFVDNSHKRLAR